MHITLFSLPYPHGRSQTYLPGGLMNLASRLLEAQIETDVVDLNHTPFEDLSVQVMIHRSDVLGISVLGPPYIAMAVRLVNALRTKGFTQPILIGGEGIARLPSVHFERLFEIFGEVRQIRTDKELTDALGLTHIASTYDTSMAPALGRVPKAMLQHYLTREFSLFLSQGCAFSCRFCAASKGIPERYRSKESLEDEIAFIMRHLARWGHPVLEAYLSNLDAFQTPDRLEEMIRIVHAAGWTQGISMRLRCLSTSKFFVRSHTESPARLTRLMDSGLWCVGFGVDGADVEGWRRENKRHNSSGELEAAFTIAEGHGITPEALMVLGFPEDTPRQIWNAVRYSMTQARRGRVLRPYLAKMREPGNEGWKVGHPDVEWYLENPERFRDLDYAMFGSRYTHPDWGNRMLANLGYGALIATLGRQCLTRPLVPTHTFGRAGQIVGATINRFMPFDR